MIIKLKAGIVRSVRIHSRLLREGINHIFLIQIFGVGVLGLNSIILRASTKN